MANNFNVMAVIQSGRLEYEAAIFALSFRRANPNFRGRLIFAEPQPGRNWAGDPRSKNREIRALLQELGGEIVPFESRHFGSSYAIGNKIEGLKTMPEGQPFVFFDTDTLHMGPLEEVPFDFSRPTASLMRENTWPKEELYGPTLGETWKSLYDLFGLDFESSLDPREPDGYWQRYLYFNAGFYYYSCPKVFGDRFTEYALTIRDTPPRELVCQELYPWLDQIALPLVIHGLGGGRDTLEPGYLDGRTTCHYRVLSLLYAREADAVVERLEELIAPNRIKKVLKEYEPLKKLVYQKKGHKIRAMFDRADLPRREQKMRNMIKKANLWMR